MWTLLHSSCRTARHWCSARYHSPRDTVSPAVWVGRLRTQATSSSSSLAESHHQLHHHDSSNYLRTVPVDNWYWTGQSCFLVAVWTQMQVCDSAESAHPALRSTRQYPLPAHDESSLLTEGPTVPLQSHPWRHLQQTQFLWCDSPGPVQWGGCGSGEVWRAPILVQRVLHGPP